MKRYPYPRGNAALRALWESSHIAESAACTAYRTGGNRSRPVPKFSRIGQWKDFTASSPDNPFVTLDYSKGMHKNIVFGAMRDRLRVVESGIMIGGYYFERRDGLHFAGWFALERI